MKAAAFQESRESVRGAGAYQRLPQGRRPHRPNRTAVGRAHPRQTEAKSGTIRPRLRNKPSRLSDLENEGPLASIIREKKITRGRIFIHKPLQTPKSHSLLDKQLNILPKRPLRREPTFLSALLSVRLIQRTPRGNRSEYRSRQDR